MAKFFLTLFSLLLVFSIGIFAFDHFAPQVEVPQKLQALIQKLTAGEEVEVKTQTDLADATTEAETPDTSDEVIDDEENLTFAEMLAKEKKAQTSAQNKPTEKSKSTSQGSAKKSPTPSKSVTKAEPKASNTPKASSTPPKATSSTVPKTPSPSKKASMSATPKGWCIQVGAFRTDEEAQRLALDLEKNRYPHFVYQTEINGNTWYRVNVGPFDSPGAAATFKQSRGIGQKFKGAFVKKL